MNISVGYAFSLEAKILEGTSITGLQNTASILERVPLVSVTNGKIYKSTVTLAPNSSALSIDLKVTGINHIQYLFIRSDELVKCVIENNISTESDNAITGKMLFLDLGTTNSPQTKTPPFSISIENKGVGNNDVYILVIGL